MAPWFNTHRDLFAGSQQQPIPAALCPTHIGNQHRRRCTHRPNERHESTLVIMSYQSDYLSNGISLPVLLGSCRSASCFLVDAQQLLLVYPMRMQLVSTSVTSHVQLRAIGKKCIGANTFARIFVPLCVLCMSTAPRFVTDHCQIVLDDHVRLLTQAMSSGG